MCVCVVCVNVRCAVCVVCVCMCVWCVCVCVYVCPHPAFGYKVSLLHVEVVVEGLLPVASAVN